MSLGKVYLASGWFSPEWLQEVENIKSVFEKHGISYFSPKDMGTIFEAGYFNCLEKPIVYFCDGLPPGAQFNLMLAASGIKVCRSLSELDSYLERCASDDELIIERYQGEIE